MSKKNRSHLRVVASSRSTVSHNRPTTDIKFTPNFQGSTCEPLNIQRTEPRNDGAPLADSGGADLQRPRDIRGILKVIDNVRLEHGPSVTVVTTRMQPHLKTGVLTSVYMDKLETLADRLNSAIEQIEKETGDKITPSDLARSCSVSPAAVSKWLDGSTKKLSADNYASASRALGVREEWLRTGRLPRERVNAGEEREIERAMQLLVNLRSPLSELVIAIDKLTKETGKKRVRT